VAESLVLTRAQVRELDRRAIEELGVPGVVLMENAGAGAAREAEDLLARAGGGPTLVLCGPGNNGGDGFVLARHLLAAGHAVSVAALSRSARGDAAVMRRIVERIGIEVLPAGEPEEVLALERAAGRPALVVDALLGTGFEGELRADVRRLTELGARLAARGALVLALDLPSGLDADSGRAAEGTLAADRTATFAAQKPGLVSPEAARWVGEVRVIGLGLPRELARAVLEPDGPGGRWTRPRSAG
jgi:NAD(P)H-hydrate epimerase